MAKRTQETNSSQAAEADIKGVPGLDDLIRQGARRIIQQAIEAELATMLGQYANVKAIDGRQVIVCDGYRGEHREPSEGHQRPESGEYHLVCLARPGCGDFARQAGCPVGLAQDVA